ncbi:MAG: ArsA family ATPase [Acidimicrobiia bacterium]
MDLPSLLDSRVCIVSGKGGVGKTTVSAALALGCAAAGRRVLLVDVEGKSGLSALFGASPLGYETIELANGVDGRTITPDEALLEFLADHNLAWLSKRLQSMNLIDVVASAAPGIKDILVLGKVKQIERSGEYDLVIVDAPAAGHTLTFLGSAEGLLAAVRVGPVLTQAREVHGLLTDPTRCKVVLVTLPEETPVNETAETADALVEMGIHTAAVIVNGWYPGGPAVTTEDVLHDAALARVVVPAPEADALAAAANFRAMRHELQLHQLGRLEDLLALPFLVLPFLFTAELGIEELEVLAAECGAQAAALQGAA